MNLDPPPQVNEFNWIWLKWLNNLFVYLRGLAAGQIAFTQTGTGVAGTVDAKLKESISVKDDPYNAKGDGVTDDTAAIQAAFDSGAQNIIVPTGVYMIDAEAVSSPTPHGLAVPSDISIEIQKGATLRAITNSGLNYAILAMYTVSNIQISGGGAIEGERGAHTGSTGEWGMGIDIRDGDDILIQDISIKSCWGDGIYVGTLTSTASQRVFISNCFIHNNRRNNISLTALIGGAVSDNTISLANGTSPQQGLDIEPNSGSSGVQSISVVGNYFVNNVNAGLRVEGFNGPARNISIVGNTFSTNCTAGVREASCVLKDSLFLNFTGNSIRYSGFHGVLLDTQSDAIVSGNSIYYSDRDGINIEDSNNNIISNNLIFGSGRATTNTYDGINNNGTSSGNVISGNNVVIAGSGNLHKNGINNTTSGGNNSITDNISSGDTASLVNTSTSQELIIKDNHPDHRTTFTDADATPSVTGVEIGECANTGATSITAFDNGHRGQILTVRIDINTTIVDDGSRLRLAGSANFTGNSDAIITLVCMLGGASSQFFEVSRSSN